MPRLTTDRRIMGRFVNSRLFNGLAWIIVAALIALSIVLLISAVFPGLLGRRME